MSVSIISPDFYGLLVIVWMLAAMGYTASLGWLVMQWLQPGWHRNLPAILACFLSSSLGFALCSSLFFVLGLMGSFNSFGMACGLIALWLSSGLLALRSMERQVVNITAKIESVPCDPILFTLFNAVILFFLFLSLVWISIRVPGMWDDTSYHLPVARHYLRQGALDINPWLRFPLFPQQANLLFAVALHWGSEVHAQAVANAIPLTLTAMGIVGMCQWQFRSSVMGWIGVILLGFQPPLWEALGYAYVDNWLMLFCWAATTGILLALRSEQVEQPDVCLKWVILAGIFAGVAASTKLFGAVFAVLIGIMLFILSPRNRRTWVYAFVVMIFGLGWYVRSFAISGDPVHPAGGNFFGYYLWNAADLAGQMAEQRTHGGGFNPLNLFSSMQHAGIAILLVGFLVVFQPRQWRGAILPMAGLMFAYLLLWQAFFPPSRYTLPILPLGSFLTVSFIQSTGLGKILKVPRGGRRLAYVGTTLAALVTVAVCLQLVSYGYSSMVTHVVNWDTLLAQRSGYEVMQAANHHSVTHGTRLVQLGYENAVYFFDGTVIGDWFGPGRYSQMMDCTEICTVIDPESLVALMDHFDTRMIAINGWSFNFEPSRYQYHELFTLIRLGQHDYLLLRK